jgi:FkbM family methyltransferase
MARLAAGSGYRYAAMVMEFSTIALKQCRHGPMLYPRGDTYVGRSLDLYGEYSEHEGRLFEQVLGPGHVVVEVGANLGAHTVHLAKLVGPGGAVLAFEPQRPMFYLLCANLALNEQFQARAHQAAMGSAPGSIKVPLLDVGATQNFGGLSLGRREGGEDIPLITLDSLALRALRLLKIDVEGMESEVILGGRETITRLRPVLYVENDRREHSARLIGMIEELGYDLYWHMPPLFNPDNFAGRTDNVFAGTVSVNMLGVPKEMGVKVPGLRRVAGPQDWWHAAG